MALATRQRLALLIALLVAVIVGAITYNRTREDRWRPVPGGGEIRLIAVTHGVPPEALFNPKHSIFEPLRSHLGPRWAHFLGPEPREERVFLPEPAVIAWFQGRNHLSGGFRTINDSVPASWDRDSTDGQPHINPISVVLPDDLCTEPRLHIRYVTETGAVDFDIANPLLQHPPPGK